MAKIDSFFKAMHDQGSSDMHLGVGTSPLLRLSGTLQKIDYPPLTDDVLRPMLYEILSEKQIAHFEETHDLDFAYSAGGIARFRCNYYLKHTGIAAAFRLIPFEIRSLEELGTPPVLKQMCEYRHGLVLVTGPTGSGKSTTLAAMIDHVNSTTQKHILTLEDPLEFIHPVKQALVSQREMGDHSTSFAAALRAALREDPDVILVGEMRDLETIELAITAAETGHLVFATLHTNNAPKTVDRIIDVFPADRQAQVRAMLAESLRGVVSQALPRTANGQGRCAVYEVMVATPAIRSLIREQKIFQIGSAISTGRKEGMHTMDQHLVELVQAGKIKVSEAIKFSETPAALATKAGAMAAANAAAA